MLVIWCACTRDLVKTHALIDLYITISKWIPIISMSTSHCACVCFGVASTIELAGHRKFIMQYIQFTQSKHGKPYTSWRIRAVSFSQRRRCASHAC